MMAEAASPGRLMVTQETRPYLPAYLKLRHDAGRGRWVLLAPERILTPDETAVAVLKLCDGKRSVEDITEALAKDYAAPVDVIRKDVLELLQGLGGQGIYKGMSPTKTNGHFETLVVDDEPTAGVSGTSPRAVRPRPRGAARRAHPSLSAAMLLLLEPARA